MLPHIQRSTEEEARRVLQIDDWGVSSRKLDAFLAVVYVLGAHNFVGNCFRHYRPGTNNAMDEQLFPS